jgi:uncharacterized protein YbjQ (UPF0145 family)
MPTCLACGKATYAIDPRVGLCNECEANLGDETSARQADLEAAAGIILTTETAHNLPVTDRLGIISAECVIGMHLFKDIAAAFRDTFGGRSQSMQDVLRDARVSALEELRREAFELGADAVVGVDLDYSEISGGGKSMLFLVATGTAVKLQT